MIGEQRIVTLEIGLSLEIGNHLGNVIGPNIQNKDVSQFVDNLCISCNALLNIFPMLSGKAKYRLYKSYLMPLHWDLSSSYVQTFFTQLRKYVRNIFNILYQTHSYLLLDICEDLPVYMEIFWANLGFHLIR